MTDLRYPTGTFSFDPHITTETRRRSVQLIAEAPGALRAAASGLDERQLQTPYRPGGWTARQVIHHVADSHANAYLRFKFALAEDNPTIKPYDQGVWARMADTALTPVDVSLALVDALHQRWVVLLESMADADFTRPLVHPEIGPITLDRLLQQYGWHGLHHVAHITELRKREGW